LDAGAVDSAFSLPSAADPAASTQAAGYALVGINRDGDTLAAHMQYRVPSFKSTGSYPYTADDEPTVTGAYLYFRAADTLGASPGPIAVYPSDTLVGLAPVSPADRVFAPGGGDDGGENHADNRIGEFTPGGAVDSVRLPDGLADSILRTRLGDTSAVMSAAFSLLGYDGEMRKIHNPYIVVHVEKGGKTVRDSISGFVRFTAFESDGALRAAYPYSSQNTLRTAVFRVNLGKMVDTLGSLGLLSGGGEILNAVIAVQCNMEDRAADSAGGGGPALWSANAGSYRIVVLDTLLTNEAPADSADAVALRSLRGQFSAVSSSARDVPYNVHSIRTPLRNAIEKYNGGHAAAYIYVYLRPVAENGMILWDRPLKVETVFTPSRSK
jgi:hypothetical protein